MGLATSVLHILTNGLELLGDNHVSMTLTSLWVRSEPIPDAKLVVELQRSESMLGGAIEPGLGGDGLVQAEELEPLPLGMFAQLFPTSGRLGARPFGDESVGGGNALDETKAAVDSAECICRAAPEQVLHRRHLGGLVTPGGHQPMRLTLPDDVR